MVLGSNGKFDGLVIIDPTSPELVRGSQCYLPYILHAAAPRSVLMENFTILDVPRMPQDSTYWIAFWSESQRDLVKTLLRTRPFPSYASVNVFGYDPLIRSLGEVPLPNLSTVIKEGMTRLATLKVDHPLAGDNDLHLAVRECEDSMRPIYTTYGCPNGCAFCAATVGCDERIVLDLDETSHLLRSYMIRDLKNVHFMDDDFFFDVERAHGILKIMVETGPWNAVVLATRQSLTAYLQRYQGNNLLEAAGIRLIEVGLETADEDLVGSMGKNKTDTCARLAGMCPVPILWLTLTFFPGETIASLRRTGLFLHEHGLTPDRLMPRIRTNGTYGGLGQFFVPSVGTKGYDQALDAGRLLSMAPLRLVPGYVPYSFLTCYVKESRPVLPGEECWYDLYHVAPGPTKTFKDIGRIDRLAERFWNVPEEAFTSLAISSRLGVIE